MEPIVSPQEPIWVKKEGAIFDSRLLPFELWQVDNEVKVAERVLLRPGDQLMTMRGRIPIRCNYPLLKEKAVAARERICVMDPDGDGTFDRIFSRSRGGNIWFTMAWEYPKTEPLTVAPVAMTKIDSVHFKGGPRIKFFPATIYARRGRNNGTFEVYNQAKLYGSDGLNWPMELGGIYRDGEYVRVDGLTIRFDKVKLEEVLVSFHGNFARTPVELPFINSYENKCDTRR